jgi:hypothetical protein
VKVRVPLCNTISAALPTSSEPSARHPTPFEVVGSAEQKRIKGRKYFFSIKAKKKKRHRETENEKRE